MKDYCQTTASFNLQTCFQKKNNTTLLLYKAASLELALATAWKSGNHSSLHASRIGGGIDLEEWIHSQDSPKEGWNCKLSWWINSAMYVALPRVEVHVNQLLHKWSILSWQHTLLVNTSNLYRIHQKCSKDGQEPGCAPHLTKHDVNTGLLHVMTHPWATTNFMPGQTLYFVPI